jgi:transcriptional regulator with XRE-family HTH domain
VSYNEGSGDAPRTPGEYVKKLLDALGETYASASRKTGVHATTIGKWIRNEIEPQLENSRRFADGIGVPRLVFMIGVGLLEPEDVQLEPIFTELAELYAVLPDAERTRMHQVMEFLRDDTRSRVDAARPQPKSRREAG